MSFLDQAKRVETSVKTRNNISKKFLNWNFDFTKKISITVDNSGKTAKTNYRFPIKIDHESLVNNNNASYIFNDLQVFDSDETTPLQFHVEAENSKWCQVWVLIPSLPASSKTIWFYFGNPNKVDSSDYVYDFLKKNELRLWIRANQPYCYKNNRNDNNDFITQFYNYGNGKKYPISTAGGDVSNEPAKTFQSGSDPSFINVLSGASPYASSFGSDVKVNELGNNKFTGIVMAKASSQVNYQSILRGQSTFSNYAVIGWGSSGNSQFILSNDGGTTGLSLGAVNNQWNILACRWQPNTTNGMNTWRNGALVAQRNSNNSTLPNESFALLSVVFPNQAPSEFFEGEIGDIFYFNDYLTNAEILEVTDYIQKKYKFWSTSDYPTITVNSVTNITTPITYTDYSVTVDNFKTFSRFSNLYFGLENATSTCTLKPVLKKVFAVGNQHENWTNTTTVSKSVTSTLQSRQITSTNTGTFSNYLFTRIIDGNNINILDRFNLANLANVSVVYVSDENDYIQFEFFCENISALNLNTSHFAVFDFTGSAIATFNKNLNSWKNGNNWVRFKKSDFVGVVNVFLNPVLIQISTVSLTSDPIVFNFSNFELIKNWEEDLNLVNSSVIELANLVQDSSIFLEKTIFIGQIITRYISSENIQLSINSYLEQLKKITFGDLDSFPKANFINIAVTDKAEFYNKIFNTIFNLIFSSDLIDVDIALPADDTTTLLDTNYSGNIPNLNFITLKSSEKIGDVLDSLCQAILGKVYFDLETLKITVRSGYTFIADYNNSLVTPYNIDDKYIIEYRDDKIELDIYNKFKLAVYHQQFFNFTNVYFNENFGLQIKAGVQTIFVDVNNEINTANFFKNIKLINQPVITDLQTTADLNVAWQPFANIQILNVFLLDNTVGITFDSNINQYIASLSINCDAVVHWKLDQLYANNTGAVQLETVTISDTESIKRNGSKELDLTDNLYVWGGYYNSLKFSNLYNSFLNFSNKDKFATLIRTVFLPDLSIGSVVTTINRDRKKIKGFVYEIENSTNGSNMYSDLSIIEL